LKREILRRLRDAKKACVDMAVYFSAGAPRWGAKIILVDAPFKLRVERIQSRGASAPRARTQARALRFGSKERRVADAVLENRGSLQELREKVDHLSRSLFDGYAQKP
jgi:dephospho-CoA kinase